MLFVHSKTEISVSRFPQSSGSLICNQIPQALKARFPGDFKSLCGILSQGSLTWGSKCSQDCENFLGIIILQSIGHPPGRYRIWFHCDCTPPTISLQLLLCFWTWGIFFLVDSSILLSMVVQQLVATVVLSQEEMNTCPSTLPSWTGSLEIFQIDV